MSSYYFFFSYKISFQTRGILMFDQPDNTKALTSTDKSITIERIVHHVLFWTDQKLLNERNLNKIKESYHICFYIAF